MKINNDTIIKDDNRLIKSRSADVPLPLSKEDEMTLKALLQYVKDSTVAEIAEKENLRPAVGIAAIQIGIPKKMIAVVIKDGDGEIVYEYALINPKIISNSVEEAYLGAGEGCLSVEGEHEGYVYRSRRIKVRAFDYLQNKEVIIKASDYLAIVLQHEIDHFSGILFYERIDKKNPFVQKKDAFRID